MSKFWYRLAYFAGNNITVNTILSKLRRTISVIVDNLDVQDPLSKHSYRVMHKRPIQRTLTYEYDKDKKGNSSYVHYNQIWCEMIPL